MRYSVLLLLCGCAVMTEEQIYESEDRLIRAREAYFMAKRHCLDNGGAIMTYPSRANKPEMEYDLHEYRSAVCVKY